MAQGAWRRLSPWRDRFRTPTVADLVNACPYPDGLILVAVRDRALRERFGQETVVWLGIPWRWTLAYWRGAAAEDPWLYIIPNPDQPRVAAPLSLAKVDAIVAEPAWKAVREGVAAARIIGHTAWAEWDVTTPEQAHMIVEAITHARRGATIKV